MCRQPPSNRAPHAASVAVEWHDCMWTPVIAVQTRTDRRRMKYPLPVSPPFSHIFRHRSTSHQIMKTFSFSARRPRAGFTLAELLVVIAIIGVLAAMLLAVLPGVVNSGKKTRAKVEEQGIVTAIQEYDSAYGRFPVSPQAQAAASANGSDFTYGAIFGPNRVETFLGSGIVQSNAEVVAILMDITNTSVTIVNANHQKNPQQTIFLNARLSGDTMSPGVGTDLVYRDPWGNPYVITMDLNYDEMCKDSFYSLSFVSGPNGNSSPGLNGLINPDGTPNNFQYHGKVMVWSAGQDGQIDPGDPATDWENRNNVLSWQ
jgi:prepilin-type N-terminal cleavage/methylation domain-containing protein